MASILNELVIDSHDAAAQAAWWSQVLGWPITSPWGEGSFQLAAPGGAGPRILFEPVPDSKTVKNRLHLDVEPREATIEQELDRLLGLGASHVDIGQGDVQWFVLADPEGNEFCLIPAQESQASIPVAVGQESDAGATTSGTRPRARPAFCGRDTSN